jgi:hypothetical protein
MSAIDIAAIKAEANKQINDEITKRAKDALVKKLRDLAGVKAIVSNIEREIADLEQSIIDGSFPG